MSLAYKLSRNIEAKKIPCRNYEYYGICCTANNNNSKILLKKTV